MTTPQTEQYVRIDFPNDTNSDMLQSWLTILEPLGILEEEDGWSCFFTIADWNARRENEFKSLIHERFLGVEYSIDIRVKENWNRIWEESIGPVQVTPGITVLPSWKEVPKESGPIVLVIDPKMSFGTGYHETTRLMLRLLENNVRSGDRILDVGTGTGILAIASILLGAAHAVGVDTDEWSYSNALENAERNGVSGKIEFYHGDMELVHGSYDVVLSNITKNDNLKLLRSFRRHAAAGASFILSGFLVEDVIDVLLSARDIGLMQHSSVSENGWTALLLREELLK